MMPDESLLASAMTDELDAYEGIDDVLPLKCSHILVVDDSPILREVTEIMLTDLGARVSLAEHGEQAVRFLRNSEHSVDLVLMDIHMPVLDGLQATEIIREALGLTDLPIIALTGSSGVAHQREAMARGVTDVIPKPVERETLLRMARTYQRSKSAA